MWRYLSLTVALLCKSASVIASCPSWDLPGVVVDGLTCAEMLQRQSFSCYEAIKRDKCCVSCESIKTDNSECEYGDRANGCDAMLCKYYSESDLSKCCATCPLAATTSMTTMTTTTAVYTSAELESTTTAEPEVTTEEPSALGPWGIAGIVAAAGIVAGLLIAAIIYAVNMSGGKSDSDSQSTDLDDNVSALQPLKDNKSTFSNQDS